MAENAPKGVSNISHFGGQELSDGASWNGYLESRTKERDTTLILPGWEIVTEVVEKTRVVNNRSVSVGDTRWLPGGPRTHAVILAGSLGLQALWHNGHNIPKLAQDGVEEFQEFQDSVEDHAHKETFKVKEIVRTPGSYEQVDTIVPGESVELEGFCTSPLGEVTIDINCAEKAVKEVETLLSKDYTIKSLTVKGSASDDYGPDGLATPNPQNNDFAEERANELSEFVKSRLGSDVQTSFGENILREDVASLIKDSVQRFGYDSQNQVEQLYKDPATRANLPPALKSLMDIQIGGSAGAMYNFKLVGPDGKESEIVMISAPGIEIDLETDLDDGDPKDQNKDYGLDMWPIIPLIIPPMPGRMTVTNEPQTKAKTKIKRRLQKVDGKLPDTVWLEMNSEILEEVEANGGRLGKDAWRFTRKYMYLMAEGRMKALQSVRFNNSESDEELDLKVAYIDHIPTAETRKAFAEALEVFASLKDGQIARDLGLIAVYPNKNCGKNKPKDKIGLGIDRQYSSGILGVAMGNIGLVELRMPEDAGAEELSGDNGTVWTLVHEVAGHFTDLEEGGSKLIKASGNKRYVTSTPWKDVASSLYSKLKQSKPNWKITRSVNSKDGETQELTWGVQESDEVKLSESDILGALKIEKHGVVTEYGGTNAAEFYAELAAAAITQEEIRFRESGLPRGFRGLDGFAQGYVPSQELVRFFQAKTRSKGEITSIIHSIVEGDLKTLSTLGEFIEWAEAAGYPKDRIKLLGHDLSNLGRLATD